MPTLQDERDPLLGAIATRPRKPFYRPRPLWLVPFALLASISRGMTLAPRMEVYTQLSCNALHEQYNHTRAPINTPTLYTIPASSSSHNLSALIYDTHVPSPVDLRGDKLEEDPRQVPSSQCVSDPLVQAGAARLQVIMTTTMGTLCALTTGWWGHFGERHGRTRVLAIASLSLLLTDLIFILVSTPSSPLSTHGHKLLIIAPILEGLLGGWSTLQSGTSAYLSDCTSSGSRAQIFSRFTGVYYVGLGLGPAFGAYLMHHPLAQKMFGEGEGGRQSVTSVFWVAIACSAINLLAVLFVFPESLNKATRNGKGKAVEPIEGEEGLLLEDAVQTDREQKSGGILKGFLSPLAIFLPKMVDVPGGKRKKDWSLTFLAMSLFGFYLSAGALQVKYLCAGHLYGWGADQLSYYISFMGGTRALYLLIVLPFFIATFKPKPKFVKVKITDPSQLILPPKKGGKLTRLSQAKEISFDLRLTRVSFFVDILSNTLVGLMPVPPFSSHHSFASSAQDRIREESQGLFAGLSSMSSVGAGVAPAIQSLALSILQSRVSESADSGQSGEQQEEGGIGRLFGALAVLQASGQAILGPLLFGLVYSETVAKYPKAIFSTAAGILFVSLVLVYMIRPPVLAAKKKRYVEPERGRSRISKPVGGLPMPANFGEAGSSSFP